MGTTPLWVPLVVAGVAVIGTLAGVVFTQVWNSRLEERRWARENDRLRETQAREDLNRTFEHRRAAYIEFQQEFDQLEEQVRKANRDREPIDFDEIYEKLSRSLTPVHVYGTGLAHSEALQCMLSLREWARDPEDPDNENLVVQSGSEYTRQIRTDLGVPAWGQPWRLAKSPESKPATDQRKRDPDR